MEDRHEHLCVLDPLPDDGEEEVDGEVGSPEEGCHWHECGEETLSCAELHVGGVIHGAGNIGAGVIEAPFARAEVGLVVIFYVDSGAEDVAQAREQVGDGQEDEDHPRHRPQVLPLEEGADDEEAPHHGAHRREDGEADVGHGDALAPGAVGRVAAAVQTSCY